MTHDSNNPSPQPPDGADSQRRFALKSLAVGLASLSAGCSGCSGGGGEDAGAQAPAPPASASPPPPAPAPAPTPAPAPVDPPPAAGAAYRYNQPYLFSSISKPLEPAHLPGSEDLKLDAVGPHRSYVDFSSGWKWRNAGGDWIDAKQKAMGTTPWATVLTNAAAGSTAGADYTADVSSALKLVESNGRWNAWILRRTPGSTAPRQLAGRFNATPAWRPVIEVSYTDGSSAILNCRVSAPLTEGLSQPASALPDLPLPATLEFDRPSKPVRSASLRFRVTQHWDGSNPLLEFFLADPPLNDDPVQLGVANTYPLDAGLATHPSIIGQHRYDDGTPASSYFYTGEALNIELQNLYDPALWGGTPDKSKLPHRGLGKWIASWDAGGAEVVNSGYRGEHFEPLAPGMGALKVRMDKTPGIGDGAEVGQSGTLAANGFIFLPESRFGRQQRLFVRYYMRIGSRHRTPYRVNLSEKYQVLKQGVPTWTDCAGKCSIGAAHKTKRGGNSGTAGGGYGWTLRREFYDMVADPDSPAAGGWGNAWSFYDYQNNPPGHNYAGIGDRAFHSLGQRGGLGGVLYADRWYCIEEEIKLNSVDQPAIVNGQPHLINGVQQYWTADGEVRCWIDGRLAYESTGMVMRSLPLVTQPPGYLPGIRELGVAQVWFNWFHGGLTKNSVDRVLFVSGLAYGDAYIGPMKI